MSSTNLTLLDSLFGPLRVPDRVDQIEKDLKPRSLQKLDDNSASLLRSLFLSAEGKLGVTAYVYCEVPILWIVDSQGDVWFSIEEIVVNDTQRFKIPRIRNTTVEDGYSRLGHPALISGESGRIAGEILFDIRAEEPIWCITNGSGRYGIGVDRSNEQLLEVKKVFENYGINLKSTFIFPRRR